jgi:hypothetical protein
VLTSQPNAGLATPQGVTVVAAEYERVISADSHVRSPGVNTHGEAAKLLGALSKGDQNKIIAANTAALYNIH